VVAKLAHVGVPLVLKEIVDEFEPNAANAGTAVRAVGGLRRTAVSRIRCFAELRDVVFVRVTQRAVRRVALNVFRHLHSLSLRFI
jgi:ATP-binding cassette subfamily B protein